MPEHMIAPLGQDHRSRRPLALDTEREVFRFLDQVSQILASTLDFEATLQSVARLALPSLADWCVVDLWEPPQGIRRVAAAHIAPSKEPLLHEVCRKYPPDWNSPHPVVQVLRSGKATMVGEDAREAMRPCLRDDPHRELIARIGFACGLCVPMTAGAQTLGTISLVRCQPGQRYTEHEMVIAEELGRRAGLAVDHARLYRNSRQAEAELQQAKAAAEAANRAKDRFLAVLSHELRTPLTPALMSAAALEQDPKLPPPVREEIGTIRRSIELEARLIDDLLDVTRIARGKLEMQRHVLDAHVKLRNAIDICREEARAKGLTLTIDLQAQAHHAKGDAGRLQQIFWNLIQNAIKFTPAGGKVEVRTRNEGAGGNCQLPIADCQLESGDSPVGWAYSPTNASPVGAASAGRSICDLRLPICDWPSPRPSPGVPGEGERGSASAKAQSLQSKAAAGSEQGTTLSTQHSELSTQLTPSLIIEIRDSGIGINPQTLPKIFKAFEQGDRAVTRQFGGLGLGLAICKTLVELHGGAISAASEGTGKGASFIVRLPTVPVPPGQPAAAGGPPRQKPEVLPRSLRILLVEDHEYTSRTLARLLRQSQHIVHTAGDIASARACCESDHFDLVISDLDLPDGNGLELMRHLREHHRLKGICLSGFGMKEDLRKSREAGFAEHLVKPVDFGRLEAAIARTIKDVARPASNP